MQDIFGGGPMTSVLKKINTLPDRFYSVFFPPKDYLDLLLDLSVSVSL